jgi:hypothetical protein
MLAIETYYSAYQSRGNSCAAQASIATTTSSTTSQHTLPFLYRYSLRVIHSVLQVLLTCSDGYIGSPQLQSGQRFRYRPIHSLDAGVQVPLPTPEPVSALAEAASSL